MHKWQKWPYPNALLSKFHDLLLPFSNWFLLLCLAESETQYHSCYILQEQNIMFSYLKGHITTLEIFLFVHCFTEPYLMIKPTKWSVCSAKARVSLGIRPVWSESSLCAQWVAKDPRFHHADSEDSDQTGRTSRLIWVFAGRTCHFVGFVMGWLMCSYTGMFSSDQFGPSIFYGHSFSHFKFHLYVTDWYCIFMSWDLFANLLICHLFYKVKCSFIMYHVLY